MQIEAMVIREKSGPFIRQTVELEAPRAGEVLVRLVATGMCHTDLAIAAQHVPYPFPAVLGHEGAGLVELVGPGVSHVSPGDPVVLTFSACGHCLNCESGHDAYCHEFRALNLSGKRADGSSPLKEGDAPLAGMFFGQSSFATHAIARAAGVVKVRADAPLELLGPLGCSIQTGAGAMLNVLKPAPDAVVAIVGVGAVGMAALMGARILGCKTIIAVDRVDSRLETARALGATVTVNATSGSLSDAAAPFSGLDVVFDTTGNEAVAKEAISRLRPNGVFALVGGAKPGARVEVELSYLVAGRKIMGISEGDAQPATFIPQLVDYYLEGRLPLEKIVRFYELDQINQAAADSLSGEAIKPILHMPKG
ncbi:MAG TPA: NAD(P)-dependent alcohol dehydrogenase [Rhizomicrobium sp.]|nr:NAD(P)-dependent alcohol dehydrogenase [Rhizomicrobium sp.]